MWTYIFLLLASNNQLPITNYQLPVSRVVSLVPSVTEIIYALGAQAQLVGVVTPCDYPPDIKKPIVGNFSAPNIERILAQEPEIVFVAGGEQKYLWHKLKELGVQIHICSPENLQEIYQLILEVGELLGKKDKADSMVNSLREEFVGVVHELPLQKRRVLIEISDNPLITCGEGSFLDELITLAGGINIAHNIKKPYPITSSEFVVNANPDVIIITHPGSNPTDRLGWELVNAVKEHRIYQDIDPNIILRPGPRVILGIKELKKRIYPELFE